MPAKAQITIRRHIYQAAGADIDDDDLDENVELMLDVERDHALMSDLLARWTPARKRDVHGLRHTSATLLLAAGVQPHIVQQRLGHTNIGTTLKARR